MIYTKTGNREGFTLIEIIIAVAIVGFMMAGAVVGLNMYRKWGATTAAKSSLKNIQTAINTYKMIVGVWPNSLKDISEKPTDPKILSKISEPLVDKIVDPWGEPFHYQKTPGKERQYELYTEGDPDDPQKIDVWDI